MFIDYKKFSINNVYFNNYPDTTHNNVHFCGMMYIIGKDLYIIT